MSKLMELVDAYGQEIKDFGWLDTSEARAAVVEAVEKLERDAARWDWLDRYIHIATWVDGEPTKLVIDAASGDEFTGETWGEALDKAMEATNGQGN